MIAPFTITIPDERLAAIRAKVEAYDWSQLPDAGGWSAGVGVGDLKRIAAYWRDSFDWRAVERRLNALPNFMAEVEGEHLHFVHVKGDGSKPPVLLLHGWPGSYLEFERLLQPLAADGHDVVVPSLPGFAFSNPITRPIGARRAAALVQELMTRLFGDARYFIQGGDWGHAVATWAAHDRPDALHGIHLNMMTVRAADAQPTTDAERSFAARRAAIADQESAYFLEQETRPQTLGAAMADSPVGAAAWILEKFGKWADLPTTADGDPDIWSKFSEEELLTTIMLYVAPGSFVTSTWIYYGSRLEKARTLPAGTRIRVPTGIAAFPDPVFLPPPRSFVEKTYDVVHWTDMPRGGHFAALEEPELMLADLRAFIATVSEARG
ncbi:pimeloyl-ACP methyl ester carboxylesterase [Sphingomonas jejuensis]|uniref:Pimeloyl-ACP methyl ester carboxylesterase n=1 Tax=Sphingomonas jejuensis TaxID=904715 RepID=A0ABX0XI22_9SPHN|nr:epoxide hydrolase family protein [Sphingomonas jejuensis]NJC32981.1 pimeloyl-ACP methyl ester carboxylesterase [Sphingomonas jejuensis]